MSPVSTRPPERAPERIVSLVPSLTESLFALELGDRVVGVTDYCVHPAEQVAALAKLGGTKNPDVDAIEALRPSLVLANHEENTRRVVEDLDRRGLEVWLTYPRTVREGAELLAEMAQLGASEVARARVCEPVLAAVSESEQARDICTQRPRVFCPIWRDPWMVAGADTYIDDMIDLCGGTNLKPAAGALKPASGALKPASGSLKPAAGSLKPAAGAVTGDARRYPRIELSEVAALAPEIVLLPDEPYAFGEADVLEIAELEIPAARDGRIHLIDGTWVSWYGPRIEPAIRALRKFLAPSRRPGA